MPNKELIDKLCNSYVAAISWIVALLRFIIAVAVWFIVCITIPLWCPVYFLIKKCKRGKQEDGDNMTDLNYTECTNCAMSKDCPHNDNINGCCEGKPKEDDWC